MTENVSEILKNGWKTWKSNLNVAFAFLIMTFIEGAILACCLATLIIPVFMQPSMNLLLTDPEAFSALPPEQVSLIVEQAISSMTLSDFSGPIVLTLAGLIFCILFDVFLLGGIYSMVCDATMSGKCSFANFFGNCKKYFFRMLATYIVLIILEMLAVFILCFIIGIIIGLIGFAIGIMIGAPEATIAIITLFAQLVAYIVVFPTIFALSFIVYALVPEDCNASTAIRKGLSFSKRNFKAVFEIGLIYAFIVFLFTILCMIPVISMISWILIAFIIQPLVVFWAIRLYMDRNGMLRANEHICEENEYDFENENETENENACNKDNAFDAAENNKAENNVSAEND